MTDNSYTRTTDGATMIEIAPFEFVNSEALRKLGLSRAPRSEQEQRADRSDDVAEAAE